MRERHAIWAVVSLSSLGVSSSLGVGACQLPNEPPPAVPQASAASPVEPAPPAPPPPEPEPAAEAPAPAAKPLEPGITATSGAPARGKLPKAVIDEKLKSAQPGIFACYERALKAQPQLRGNVSVSFVVAPDGKVVHAEALDTADELTDAPVVECVLAEVRKLEFPEPSGGRVFINYPIRLEPAKPAAP